MARTAMDTALLLSAMSGPDPACTAVGRHSSVPASGDARSRPPRPAGGLESDARRTPDRGRRANSTRAAIETLAGLGPAVEAAEPDLSGADLVFETWRAYLMALGLGDLLAADGDHMKETLRWNIRRGLELTAADLMAADRAQVELHTRVYSILRGLRLPRLPGYAALTVRTRERVSGEVAGVEMGTYLEWMRACSRITATCHPAVSVPIGFTAAGLPVGLQLVGRPFAELALLELAHALEGALGVVDTLPPAVA